MPVETPIRSRESAQGNTANGVASTSRLAHESSIAPMRSAFEPSKRVSRARHNETPIVPTAGSAAIAAIDAAEAPACSSRRETSGSVNPLASPMTEMLPIAVIRGPSIAWVAGDCERSGAETARGRGFCVMLSRPRSAWRHSSGTFLRRAAASARAMCRRPPT